MPTTAERAYRFVKTDILTGRFASGSRLTEDAIAQALDISRTPVRDALRRLHAEGLIHLTPNSGARVASWSAEELDEILEMRVRLEGLAAELAARKIGPDELAELERLCEEMEAALDGEPDLDRISVGNLAFHRVIARAAGNARLAQSVESLGILPLAIRKFALFDRKRLLRSFAHHRELVAALHARDPQWAGMVMQTHIIAARAYDAMLNAPAAERVARATETTGL